MTGEGTTGIDDQYAEASFDEIGAEIGGASMFGLHTYPDDPEWLGWWGDEPPFRVPVFVLTHTKRPSIEMVGGTTFHFLSAAPEEALERALDAAEGKDVRVGGGATVVRRSSRPDSWTSSTSRSRRSCSDAASACGTDCGGSSPDMR